MSAEAARGTRFASLAQIGELARRLQIGLLSLRCRRNLTPVSNVCQATQRSFSPPQSLPLGIPIKKSNIPVGDDGKREKAGARSLSPSYRAPRALFSLLPSLPTTQRGRCSNGEERVDVTKTLTCEGKTTTTNQ